MPSPTPIRVAIAEDNALLRDGLARLISSTKGFELVGTAASYDELLALVKASKPDVVVTDIRMPPTGTDEGIRAAAALRDSDPQIGVIVLSQFVSPAYALALLSQGSERRGYLLKDRVADVDDLVDAIRVVHDGGAVIDPKVVEQLVTSSSRRAKAPIDFLTPREREVLAEMAQGKSNAAVAAALVLSERAVEKHINSIFSKLHLTEERDVNRRVAAVLLFLTEGGAGHTPDDVSARFPGRD
ncbi:MAG TPA: response regulator transcription factor [Ilumatobacteraceae bacterium]